MTRGHSARRPTSRCHGSMSACRPRRQPAAAGPVLRSMWAVEAVSARGWCRWWQDTLGDAEAGDLLHTVSPRGLHQHGSGSAGCDLADMSVGPCRALQFVDTAAPPRDGQWHPAASGVLPHLVDHQGHAVCVCVSRCVRHRSSVCSIFPEAIPGAPNHPHKPGHRPRRPVVSCRCKLGAGMDSPFRPQKDRDFGAEPRGSLSDSRRRRRRWGVGATRQSRGSFPHVHRIWRWGLPARVTSLPRGAWISPTRSGM